MVLFIHSARIDAMSSLWDLRIMFFSRMAKTAGNMVVDQSARLHKGVTDSRTDKLETAFFNALASASDAGVEVGILSRLAARVICGWPSTNDQTKSAKDSPFCSIASRAGVTDNGLNFTAMSYDARVLQQAFNLLLLHSCDAYRVKLMKTGAVVLPLFKHGDRDKPAC